MPQSEHGTFPNDVVGVLASYFSGGAGPSHSMLNSAMASAGIDDDGSGSNKESRVHAGFRNASQESAYRFADELLGLIRRDNAFSRNDASAWARRAKAAFRRAGYALDDDGYPDWGPVVSDAYDDPRRGARASAAGSRAAARPDGVIGRSEVPPRMATPPGAYLAGDAIGPLSNAAEAAPTTPEIFLVHGQDEVARNEVDNWIRRETGIEPIVLMLEPSRGLTVIEKFEHYAGRSGYAVVLMTADDLGGPRADFDGDIEPKARARQNVIFEFGYFVGAIRRSHVAALVSRGVEKPSDIAGLVYIDYSRGSDWKDRLRVEMREAGIPFR